MTTQATKKVAIKAKESNSGSIYDLSNAHYDIEMDVPVGGYAVIIPSYYNAQPVICADVYEVQTAILDLAGYENVTVLNDNGDEVAVEYCDKDGFKIDSVENFRND